MSRAEWAALAARLVAALRPLAEPIGIAFVAPGEANPAPAFGAPRPAPNDAGRTGAVPAGCVFWMKATERAFSTVAADHANCSVGSYTHGFLTLAEAAARDDVAAVLEAGWVDEASVATLPHLARRPGHVVYGPLATLPADPDVVLLRIYALALMTLKDAFPSLRIEGKPQCHIIAIAVETGAPAASVGCALSRARTGMKAEEMTCALPAAAPLRDRGRPRGRGRPRPRDGPLRERRRQALLALAPRARAARATPLQYGGAGWGVTRGRARGSTRSHRAALRSCARGANSLADPPARTSSRARRAPMGEDAACAAREGERLGGSAPGTIGRRLTWTVLGTTALAVALACAGFALHQARSSRASLLAGLESLAEMIGYNAMLPLVAGDAGPVESTLLALTSNEAVEAAAVYARDGRLFARFARDYEGAPGIPTRAPEPGTRSEGDALILVRAIAAGGEVVGTVLLRVSTQPLRRQLAGSVAVAGGAFVLCLAPALFATTRLRRELSAPLAALAASAERVSAGDFRARVSIARSDEIGVLAQAFNGMAARLRGLIAEVTTSAREVLEGMGTLREASRRSREQAQTQRASVDRTSSAIERTEVSLEAVGKATEKLSECTSATAASANQVDASTRNVRESIDLLFELIAETASALSQSVESIRQVGDNATHLDQASARTASSVEQLAASVQSVGDDGLPRPGALPGDRRRRPARPPRRGRDDGGDRCDRRALRRPADGDRRARQAFEGRSGTWWR